MIALSIYIPTTHNGPGPLVPIGFWVPQSNTRTLLKLDIFMGKKNIDILAPESFDEMKSNHNIICFCLPLDMMMIESESRKMSTYKAETQS